MSISLDINDLSNVISNDFGQEDESFLTDMNYLYEKKL